MRKKILISLLSIVILGGSYVLFTSLKPESKKIKTVNPSLDTKLRSIGFDLLPSEEENNLRNKFAALGLRYVTQTEIGKIIDSHRLDHWPYTVTWTTYPASEYRGNIPEDVKAQIIKNYELIKDDINDLYKVRILGPVDKNKVDPIAYVFIKGGGYVFLAEWE